MPPDPRNHSEFAGLHSTIRKPMLESPFHRAIYLTGATAAGKTAVGVALARVLGAEVVALDSMTLYRGMDIGTAKPTLRERGGVAHHLIDVLEPWEAASVAQYRARAAGVVAEIEGRGNRVLFVGGTALYLKALLRGLFEGPAGAPELRRELEEEAQRFGAGVLHARLAAVDPASACRLHPNDQRRLVRALEVIALTGRPLSVLQREHDRPAPAGVAVFALERPRPELYTRIDARVLAMFADGLIEEVRTLNDGPNPIGPVPAQGVGYREVLDYFKEGGGLERVVSRVQTRTRQFAKRQATWFRGLAEVRPWPVSPNERAEVTAERLAEHVASSN